MIPAYSSELDASDFATLAKETTLSQGLTALLLELADVLLKLQAIVDKPTSGGGSGASTDISTLAKEATLETLSAKLNALSVNTGLDLSPLSTALGQTAGNNSLSAIALSLNQQALVNKRQSATRTWLSGMFSTSGDNSVIVAPAAGTQIVISELRVQSNATTAQTVLVKRGAADVNPLRIRCVSDGNGLSEAYSTGNELRFGSAVAFMLNLSAPTAVGLTIRYWVENVATGEPV